MKKYIVSSQESGQTLEKYVRKALSSAPLSFIYKLFRKRDIKVNGVRQNNKYVIKENDILEIYITDAQVEEFESHKGFEADNEIEPLIVYEDANILAVNKPRGTLVQKDSNSGFALDDKVINYLIYKNEYNPNDQTAFTPGPAHRLDRNTSGLVLFGKNNQTLQYLFSLFKDHNHIEKHYLVLVIGTIDEDGEINIPLKKDEKANKVFPSSLKEGGKTAKTIYKVVRKFKKYTLLDVTLVTGRTHQIRVHFAFIGHPVVGDSKYGDFALNDSFNKEYHFKNQFLHAYKIIFKDLIAPLEYLSNKEIRAEIGSNMKSILDSLE